MYVIDKFSLLVGIMAGLAIIYFLPGLFFNAVWLHIDGQYDASKTGTNLGRNLNQCFYLNVHFSLILKGLKSFGLGLMTSRLPWEHGSNNNNLKGLNHLSESKNWMQLFQSNEILLPCPAQSASRPTLS